MVTFLDGGMGQELLARSALPPTPLWATQVMLETPDIVRAIHDDYFAAGADIATTNTYAVHHDRLIPYGVDDRFRDLQEIACRMAVEARDAHGSGRIAGAIGPLGASYRPDLAPEPTKAAELYAEICMIQNPFVDLFLCETVASVEQARGALMGTLPFGKPVWLALSVSDDDGLRLRSGEALSDILPLLVDLPPDAILINCSPPETVDQGLDVIAQASLPFGAYANGFTHIAEAFRDRGKTADLLEKRQDLPPDRYADFAQGWVARGATIVGGCCEVGPAHIRRMVNTLKG